MFYEQLSERTAESHWEHHPFIALLQEKKNIPISQNEFWQKYLSTPDAAPPQKNSLFIKKYLWMLYDMG